MKDYSFPEVSVDAKEKRTAVEETGKWKVERVTDKRQIEVVVGMQTVEGVFDE